MARSVPKCPDPPNQASGPGRVIRKYDIHVVTPIFGGGAQPGVNDPNMVRGSAIRGHLRFWWRASRGACCSLSELRKREGEIWGTTSSPSKVIVRVTNVNPTNPEPWTEYPVRKGDQEAIMGEFQLTLEWPEQGDIGKEVEAALWAWTNFGGLGSRTRRGCGSLYLASMAPGREALDSAEGLQKWYMERCSKYGIVLNCDAKDWLTLPDKLWTIPSKKTPREAWNAVVHTLGESRKNARAPRLGQYDQGQSQRAKDGRERTSNPLVLKAMAVEKNVAVPIILRLRTAARWRTSPRSALDAFIKFATESEGYR